MRAASVLVRLMAPVLAVSCALAQGSEPFPQPIGGGAEPIRVTLSDFAALPAIDGVAARMMLMVDEPGTRRLFVNDMRGPIYTVSYDGRSVTRYLDINATQWGVRVIAPDRERGFQSFALHPQFGQPGTRGYGKIYTFTDTANQTPRPDFLPNGNETTHDTVLLEWTAKTPSAATYDGGAPRELFRLRDPFTNHNGGHIAFNPLAAPGSPDFGLLYMGVSDGGSGGDPLKMAQDMSSAFGKIFRIDPLGNNSVNKQYGIPADNPYVADNSPRTLAEIYAVGVRNPQRFNWDAKTGNLYVADIGQGIVEEISQVTRGANLGWSDWEGSYRYNSRTAIDMTQRRSDPRMTYPIVEYDHRDPVLVGGRAAITGVVVYRGTTMPALSNMLLFGDNPTGEVFAVNADRLPNGGQDAIRRVLFMSGGTAKTFLQVIREKTPNAPRVDLRFGTGPSNQVFLLNKQDGIIRQIVP